MALLRYFHPKKTENQIDPHGPLSKHVPSEVIKSVNVELRKDEDKRSANKSRGEYTKISPRNKAQVAKYASENGIARTLRHFKDINLKETSVRDWKRAYEKELKSKCAMETGTDAGVKELLSKKHGRPPMIGQKADEYLRKVIIAMRERGTPIGTTTVVGIGRGVVLKTDRTILEEFGGPVKLNKEWAKSVLRRMGFTKRRANSKAKVIPDDFVLLKEQFLLDIRTVALMEDIPADLVVNWDQTAMKIVPSCSWTMERKGTKRVEIAAIDDKRQITAVFACSLTGNFLPVQLIYGGTTQRCLPKNVDFPEGWHITFSANHWSNENTMEAYIQKILLPYVTLKREQLGLEADHCALAIFDVFKGLCTEKILSLLENNNILYVTIPSNCTDRLQPLDVSVNKSAKDFMKSKFQKWYGNIIHAQLEENVTEPVDMRLSIMKPLTAQWMIELHQYLVSNPHIIINGFKGAGITLFE